MNVGITTSKQATFYYLRVSQLFLPNLKQGLPQFEIVGLQNCNIFLCDNPSKTAIVRATAEKSSNYQSKTASKYPFKLLIQFQ